MNDVPVIPQANIDLLMQDPDKNRTVFDQMYGEGAADRALNGVQRVNPNSKPTPDGVEEDNESWVGWLWGESVGAAAYGVQSAANEGIKAVESFDEWVSGSLLADVPTRLVWGEDENGEWTFGLYTYQEALDMGATNDALLGGQVGVKRDTYEIDVVEAPETLVGRGVSGISQFVVGMVGVGKFTKLKGVYGALANGAIVDAALFNPNDPNLTGMLNDFGVDTGAFGELMATDPDDPEWQNRLRNAAEGTLIGGLVEAIAYGVRAKRLASAGKAEEAAEASRQAVIASRKVEAELVREGKVLSDDIGQTLELADKIQGIDAGKLIKDALDDVDEVDIPRVTTVKPTDARRLTPDEIKLIQEVSGIRSIAKNNNPKITPNLAEGLGITRPGRIKKWEDMLPLMSAMRSVLKADWDAAAPSGRISNKVTNRIAAKSARELAQFTGESPEAVIARFKSDMPNDPGEMTAELKMRTDIVASLMTRIRKMDEAIATGQFDPDKWRGYRSMDELVADRDNSYTLASALAQETAPRASEVGRALQILRERPNTAVEIERIGRLKGDAIMAARARLKAEAEGRTPTFKEVEEEVTRERRWADKINAYRVNALLSGPGTQEVNFISTMLNSIKIPTEQVVGGALSGDMRMTVHGLRTLRGMIASSFDAIQMMKQAWDESDAILDNINKIEDDARAEIPGWMQLPSRMLLAMDEMFKQSAYRGRVIADALEAADVAMLKGKDREEFVRGYLADSFDADGKATRKDALLQAQKTTFTQPLEQGSIGKVIQDNAAKYPPLRFIVPFVRTPINILSEAIQMMPGIRRLSRRYKDDIAAGGIRAAQQRGKGAIGLAMSIGMVTLAMNDMITGSGPRDARLRKAWLAAGNRPYSVKLKNEDGSIRWVSYARYEPAAQVMAIAADWVEILNNEYGENEASGLTGVAKGLLFAFAENSVNKTFTQGIHDFFTVLTDGQGQAGERAFNNMMGSFVPNFLNQTNGDMAFRETRDLMDTIMSRTPGYGKLDPKRNVLGEVIYRANPKYDPMSLMSVDIVPNDPVTQEIWKVAKGAQTVAGLPSRFLNGFPNEPGGRLDLGKIPYKDGQSVYDRYVEMVGEVKIGGKTLRQALEREFKTKRYQRMMPGTDGMTKGTRAHRITQIMGKYREKAKAEFKEYRELERISKDQQKAAFYSWRKNLRESREAPIFMKP